MLAEMKGRRKCRKQDRLNLTVPPSHSVVGVVAFGQDI